MYDIASQIYNILSFYFLFLFCFVLFFTWKLWNLQYHPLYLTILAWVQKFENHVLFNMNNDGLHFSYKITAKLVAHLKVLLRYVNFCSTEVNSSLFVTFIFCFFVVVCFFAFCKNVFPFLIRSKTFSQLSSNTQIVIKVNASWHDLPRKSDE